MIIHFGRNPDSGGSSSDSIFAGMTVVSRSVLFHVWDRVLLLSLV